MTPPLFDFAGLANSAVLLALADAAIKSAALLAVAAMAVFSLRKASAAARHAVWCGALAGALLLPILSFTLPAWRVPWLPEWRPQISSVQLSSPAPHLTPVSLSQTGTPASSSLPIQLEIPKLTTNPLSVESSPLNVERSLKISPQTLFFLWLSGAFLSLLPLLAGWCHAARLTRRGRILENPEWRELLEEVSRTLDLRRGINLRSASGDVMPFTWGEWRPTVVFPEAADEWPLARRRLVLLHELGHIKRHDWLTQTLGALACALYWFNPLAWLAARQLRLEREQACDDLVLRCGQAPGDYARELLEIAAASARHRVLNWVAVPVARPGKLETRLRAILDGSRNRRTLTRAALLGLLVIFAAIVIPMAMLRAAVATKPAAAPSPAPATVVTSPSASPSSAKTNEQLLAAERYLAVINKLQTIVIPSIDIATPTPLDQIITVLHDASVRFDPDGKGVNFAMLLPPQSLPPKITLAGLTNLSVEQLLNVACKKAGYVYNARDGIIELAPASATTATSPLGTPSYSYRYGVYEGPPLNDQAADTSSPPVTPSRKALDLAVFNQGQFGQSPADLALMPKLRTIVIPSIDIAVPTSLEQIAVVLHDASMRFDPDGKGVNLVVISSPNNPAPTITLASLTNLSVEQLLNIACKKAGYIYTAQDGVIELVPAPVTTATSSANANPFSANPVLSDDKINQPVHSTATSGPDASDTVTFIVPLKYAQAANVVRALQSPPSDGTNTIFAADDRTNSVVVTADKKNEVYLRLAIYHLDTDFSELQAEVLVLEIPKTFKFDVKTLDLAKIQNLPGVKVLSHSTVPTPNGREATLFSGAISSTINQDGTPIPTNLTLSLTPQNTNSGVDYSLKFLVAFGPDSSGGQSVSNFPPGIIHLNSRGGRIDSDSNGIQTTEGGTAQLGQPDIIALGDTADKTRKNVAVVVFEKLDAATAAAAAATAASSQPTGTLTWQAGPPPPPASSPPVGSTVNLLFHPAPSVSSSQPVSMQLPITSNNTFTSSSSKLSGQGSLDLSDRVDTAAPKIPHLADASSPAPPASGYISFSRIPPPPPPDPPPVQVPTDAKSIAAASLPPRQGLGWNVGTTTARKNNRSYRITGAGVTKEIFSQLPDGQSLTVAQAVQQAGTDSLAKLSAVRLIRYVPDPKTGVPTKTEQIVNVDDVLNHGNKSTDIVLQNGDWIIVGLDLPQSATPPVQTDWVSAPTIDSFMMKHNASSNASYGAQPNPSFAPGSLSFNKNTFTANTLKNQMNWFASGPSYSISGQGVVGHAGQFPLSHDKPLTLTQAVQQAGYDNSSNLSAVRLSRLTVDLDTGKLSHTEQTVNVEDILNKANKATDIVLQDGDMITVEQKAPVDSSNKVPVSDDIPLGGRLFQSKR